MLHEHWAWLPTDSLAITSPASVCVHADTCMCSPKIPTGFLLPNKPVKWLEQFRTCAARLWVELQQIKETFSDEQSFHVYCIILLDPDSMPNALTEGSR